MLSAKSDAACLGVGMDADLDAIKKAYRGMARNLHPVRLHRADAILARGCPTPRLGMGSLTGCCVTLVSQDKAKVDGATDAFQRVATAYQNLTGGLR